MSRKIFLKRASAFAMAMALTAMSTGITAFADPAAPTAMTPLTVASSAYITLNKFVPTDGKTYAPETTFTFKVKAATAAAEETTKKDGDEVFSGIEDGLLFVKNDGADLVAASDEVTLVYNNTSKFTDLKDSYNETATLYADADKFKDSTGEYQPGVYKYEVTEVIDTGNLYPGIIYDAKPKEVYVYVEWKDAADKSKGLEVKYVIAADGTDASTKSTLDFTNRYDNPGNTPGTPGTEPGGSDGTPGKPSDGKDDPSDPKADTDNPGSYTHILQVSKTVTGNQGSKINEFKFKVEIKPATTGTRKYAVYKTDANGNEESTPTTITANGTTAGSADILLKDGEKLTVYGLTKNDKYTVTEEETTTIKKYTTTISHDGTNMAGKTNLTANRTTDEITNDGSADAVEYVNDKSVTTPTGIVTEYAPYILLICAAGAFALIFLRKRNNREDY